MARLTKQQLDQVRYVSMADFSSRVDQIEDIDDKLEFAVAYLLDHGRSNEEAPEYPIEEAIHIARMKIADASAKLKEEYQKSGGDLAVTNGKVNPFAKSQEQDLALEMFLSRPGSFLKGRAEALSNEIRSKNWMDKEDAERKLNCDRLRVNILKPSLNEDLLEMAKKPTSLDVQARLEQAYGGKEALQRAYHATRPSFFAKLFNTTSLAAKNLDAVYQAFFNPGHALYGNMPSMEKAAKEYLAHVLPHYRPSENAPLPQEKDLLHLSSTEQARATLSINILKSVQAERAMEDNFFEMVEAYKDKDIAFSSLPASNRGVMEVEAPAISESQAKFQASIAQDLIEEEASEKLIDEEEASEELIEEESIEGLIKEDAVDNE